MHTHAHTHTHMHTHTHTSMHTHTHTHRYINNADEPDDTDREIVFTVFDGNSSGSDSIILRILTQDDNPTMVCIHVTRQPEPYSPFLVMYAMICTCVFHIHTIHTYTTQTHIHSCMYTHNIRNPTFINIVWGCGIWPWSLIVVVCLMFVITAFVNYFSLLNALATGLYVKFL